MRSAKMMIAMACGFATLLGGCAQQQTVDELRRANQALNQRVVELEQDREAMDSTNEVLRNRLNAESTARGEAVRDLERLRREMRDITGRLDEFRMIALPEDLDMALRQLAERYPGLMTYDPQRGMVQLSSDLTFGLGSDQVTDQARQSLTRLAEVLKGEAATGFEVRVVGHTDNVPIGKPETRAKHPTNMHLSVHRAIGVRRVLLEQGIEPGRVSIGGWGEHRPVVANQPRTGAEQNRRVELFLVPMSEPIVASGAIEMGQPRNEPEQPAPTRAEEPLK